MIMACLILLFFTTFNLQHTIESIREKSKAIKLRESEVTKKALIKLIKIKIFMVKKHLAYTTKYKDFVHFIGSGLGDPILLEYLKYTDYHKNAMYLSANSVTEFIKVISDWMHMETISLLRDCNDVTQLLDETSDISNRSELSLMARIV